MSQTLRSSAVAVLLAPVAAVAMYWFLPALDYPHPSYFERGGHGWLLVFISAVPLVAAACWTAVRTRSAPRTFRILIAMAISTFVLWWIALIIILLVASLDCPPNAYECPI